MKASPQAQAAFDRADLALAGALATLAEHEVNVFAPVRGIVARNHIADKIKTIFAA